MLEITPPGEELELHLNLLRHGRRTCHARKPDCAGCALRRMCPSAEEFLAARSSDARASVAHVALQGRSRARRQSCHR